MINGIRYIIFLSALFCSFIASSDTKNLTACGHPFYPPVSWIDNNQLTGLAPYITQQLFSELGYKVQLISDYNWKRCLLEAKLGNVDIVVAAYKISERKKYLYYSQQPIIADPISFFVHKNHNSKFSGLNDLKNKTVGLLLGDSFGEETDLFLKNNSDIEFVSNNQQNFKKLALQRIDYMPVGRLSGQLQSQKLNFHNHIKPLDYKVSTEFYFLAVSHKSYLGNTMPYLNQRLQEMASNGSIKKLTEQFSKQYLQSP